MKQGAHWHSVRGNAVRTPSSQMCRPALHTVWVTWFLRLIQNSEAKEHAQRQPSNVHPRDSHTVKVRQRTRLDARCTKMPKVSPVKKCVRNTGEADER